jgi:hypothetical protein
MSELSLFTELPRRVVFSETHHYLEAVAGPDLLLAGSSRSPSSFAPRQRA